MNTEQTNAFDNIITLIKNNSHFCENYIEESFWVLKKGLSICISGRAGRGKSYLTGQILKELEENFNYKCLYITATCMLEEDFRQKNKTIDTMTICRFTMSLLKCNYCAANYIWNDKGRNIQETLDFFYINTNFDFLKNYKVICIDEYTLLHPWMITYCMILAEQKEIIWIFVGDFNQHEPLGCTPYHISKSNYYLVRHCSYFIELQQSVRHASDSKLDYILNYFIEHFNENDFQFKLWLFEQCESHFLNKEDYKNCLFVSSFHNQIRKRIERAEKKEYLLERSFYKKSKIQFKTKKYLPYIPLLSDCNYFYINKKTLLMSVVKLINIVNNKIYVQDMNNGKFAYLDKISVNSSFMTEELFKLLGNGCYQYPIKFFASTTYSLQGKTIANINLDIELDNMSIKGVYVAISRVTSLKQINKFKTNDILSLLVTSRLKKTTGYYFKISKNIDSVMISKLLKNEITVTIINYFITLCPTVEYKSIFEKSSCCKIREENYNRQKNTDREYIQSDLENLLLKKENVKFSL